MWHFWHQYVTDKNKIVFEIYLFTKCTAKDWNNSRTGVNVKKFLYALTEVSEKSNQTLKWIYFLVLDIDFFLYNENIYLFSLISYGEPYWKLDLDVIVFWIKTILDGL